jgi:hypothetical protein
MFLNCSNQIIDKDLAIHFDISDTSSFNGNSGLTITSLNYYDGYKLTGLTLNDFGLTMFDVGRTNLMYSNLNLVQEDKYLKLYRIGYNIPTGTTTLFNDYQIAIVTGESVGTYYQLSGGFLQNYFKLHDYNYELFPYRYNNGITVELSLKIDSNTFTNNGNFLFIGQRAEDKYKPYFSGETQILTETQIIERQQYSTIYPYPITVSATTTVQSYDGVFTSENNYLIGDANISDLNENVIAFGFDTDGKINVTTVDKTGQIRQIKSTNRITETGWTIISISYKPYNIISDPDLLDCTPNRLGDFAIYVDGKNYLKIRNFEEFWFKPVNNDREKQIGVPYTISFGGGSFGLKHSYHYDYKTYPIYSGYNITYINNSFSVILNPNDDNDCVAASAVTAYNTSYGFAVEQIVDYIDDCSGTTFYKNGFKFIGNTGSTQQEQYFIDYDTPISLLSNREYTFNLSFYDNGIFLDTLAGSNNSIGLVFYDNNEIKLVQEATSWQYNPNSIGELQTISYKVTMNDDTDLQNIKVGILISSPLGFNNSFEFIVDTLNYSGQDAYAKDNSKQNQLIEQYFSNSFIGGIQKLRMYNRALNPQEIQHNVKIDSTKYGINRFKGGRIIYY